jgi:hypothetical protein
MTSIQSKRAHPGKLKAWALWDAGELVSLHTTEPDAHDAREARLHQLRSFADPELCESAVHVLPVFLQTP